jgi:hypothetical protein
MFEMNKNFKYNLLMVVICGELCEEEGFMEGKIVFLVLCYYLKCLQ